MFRSNLDNFYGPGYHRRSQSLKSGPNDYVSHPKPIHTVCGAVSIVSRQYGWNIIRSSLHDFSGPRYHKSRKSWKTSPNDSVLHLKHTYNFNFYHFSSIRLKNVSAELWRLFGYGHNQSRKSWKRAHMTRFSARNLPTLFRVQFLSFRIDRAKECLGWILTTFPGLGTTRAGKVENRSRMTRFWHPKYTHDIWDICLIVSHP